MKLLTFGDSWTEGVGGNLEEEKKLKYLKKERV